MGGLQRFTVAAGQPEAEVAFGEGGGTVTVVGGTVWYRDEPGVTAGTADGSIVSGSSVTLYGTQFFSTTALRVDGQVRLSDSVGSSSATAVAVGAPTGVDDTAAVLAGLAVAQAANKGVLALQAGTYVVAAMTWTLTRDLEVVGDGERLTTIKLKNAANADLLTIPWTGFIPRFRRINFDGNSANQTTGSCVVLPDSPTPGVYGGSARFYECNFSNGKVDNLKVGAARNDGRLMDCSAGPAGACNVTMDGTDWTIRNPEFGNAGTIGVHGTSGCTALAITGGGVFKAGTHNIKIDDAHYCWISGVSIDTGQQVGLYLGAIGSTTPRQHIVFGNKFVSNSAQTTNTWSDIVLAQVDGPVIVGNGFFHFAGANRPKYLVECVTSPANIVFSGNGYSTDTYGTALTNDLTKFAVITGSLDFLNRAANPRFTGILDVAQTYVHGATGSTDVEKIFIDGEGTQRFGRTADGKMYWTGGASFENSNLYRLAANQLKTDAKLLTALGLGVGNSAAATTLGALSKKMEVFDAAGTSLGFVPIYTTIT